MSSNVPTDLIQFIHDHQFFCVMGHEGPDLDCLCSQLALASILRKLGKKVALVSKGPFSRQDVKDMQDAFEVDLPLISLSQPGAAVLLVDCAALLRTGYEPFICQGMAIDHHACIEEESFPGYIDAHAPSATLLILRLMRALKQEPTPQEIEWIMTGFCTDSGFFRHLGPNAAPYMCDVGELLAGGISVAQIHEKIEGRFSLASRQYMGKLLCNAQSYASGRLIMIVEESYDLELDRDSAGLYRLLLSVDDVEVVILMRIKDNGYSVGVRSRGETDVAKLAAHFGGGGHVKAAGFFTTENPEIVRDFFIQAIKA
ncbi:MAG: DHH family phosphoesterase [Spirochaetia bacterium]